MDTPDLIKWRQEQPLDYIQAMHTLLESHVHELTPIFLKFYKYSRCYIPNVLYKYYSLDDSTELSIKKLDTLRKQEIFLALIKTLNDPFDSKAFFYNPEPLKKFEQLKECDGRIIDDFSSFFRIASFTACGVSSLPMWAHYSNNHQGYCVSYDMTDNQNSTISGCTYPIQYTTERVDLTEFMLSQLEKICARLNEGIVKSQKVIELDDFSIIYLTILLSNIKNSSWSYEKEFRCSIGRDADKTQYLPAVPKEIYIGLNCSEFHTEKLIEIGRELGVPVYKMKFDDLDTVYGLRSERVE